ncbi:MFS transporter [Cordyceps fumosorosea ARSEF 2679]|uniref:MFS transporter n=1 Tax=Cordyceps fumosorosea (strain ARSEF 2679) TaxID=1081104 RepID=A0A167ZH40_CORFA|nr:MFS transporter [Cordyceps fumosorosea ARSEF 2679]OAA67507.1 MFS transporter [Cordyceps fumosorosea ARSEF 2679]
MAATDAVQTVTRPLDRGSGVTTRKATLGNVRLRDQENNEIILIPTPSSDPNDPLNWSQWRKKYAAIVLCVAMAMCNFLAAGPSIAIVQTAMDFFPQAAQDGSLITYAIPRVAYFFTSTSLLQGMGNLFWIPAANKWGRRPIYIASYAIYFATAVWLIFEKSYAGFLVGRILMGFGAGAAETLAPVTITDLFFLHERGAIMSAYTCFLSIGVAFGMIVSGGITANSDWRTIYEVSSALIGFVLLLLFFTLPETAYKRVGASKHISLGSSDALGSAASQNSDAETGRSTVARQTYWQSLKVFRRQPLTNESIVKMMMRPFALILLPSVLWAALVLAVTIGFLVAVTSNVDPAFEEAYRFQPWQVGLCFFAAIIGSILGLPAGGKLGDLCADYLTRRNGGIREPEMRLPTIMISAITTPLALVLYGVGIQHHLSFICPTIGLALLNFSITQASTVCIVYVIDSYRPVAGEVTLAVMGFKSLFGFLLSFETNPWINKSGYQNAYGAMAGISTAVIILWIPLYFWGKVLRTKTWRWRIMTLVHWADDREVGE